MQQRLTTVIPVYNGERFLPPTLEAVARQTRPADRVIVLDNCSTDSTPDLVRNFPLRIEYIRNDANLGIIGNLNKGLGFAAETDYLHLLTADDLVTADFYEKMVRALERCEGRALGYAFNEEINADGEVIGPLTRLPTGPEREVPMTEFLTRQSELNTVLLPAVLFKTNRQPSPALFPQMPQVGDSYFLGEWAHKAGQVVEVREYLCQYRLSPFNQTSRNIRNIQAWMLDEWIVMQTLSGWIDEGVLARAIRRQKLRLLFCARSYVKAQMMRGPAPDYSRQIAAAARGTTSGLHWALGRMAVLARDAMLRMRGQRKRVAESVNLGPTPTQPSA